MMKSDLGLQGGRKRVGWDQSEDTCERLLRVPEIVLLLPLEPEPGRGARKAGEAGGHVRADCRLAGKDPVERLAGDAKLAGRLAHGQDETGQNPIAQDPSRMGWSCRESVSGAGHGPAFVMPTVALWVTGGERQEAWQFSGHEHRCQAWPHLRADASPVLQCCARLS